LANYNIKNTLTSAKDIAALTASNTHKGESHASLNASTNPPSKRTRYRKQKKKRNMAQIDLIKTIAKTESQSQSQSQPKPTSTLFTIDTLLNILQKSLLNPFIAWILVLCLRAQVTPLSHPSWILTVTYAISLTTLWVLRKINERVAHGVPRTVDFENEVVVITGGASGLGLLIAQNYGMRGASVAVLDVRDLGEEAVEEAFGVGVLYVRCDVGNRVEVESAKGRIVAEVCLCHRFPLFAYCIWGCKLGLQVLVFYFLFEGF
jgi:hypothetical protein